MHADRPGDRPRILYWYRTAPGIVLGRAPLDEDAIRTIEEQHPGIDFDWPAILALSEVMTPEDEAPPQGKSPGGSGRRKSREPRRERDRDRPSAAKAPQAPPRREPAEGPDALAEIQPEPEPEAMALETADAAEAPEPRNRLLEELAGREIGARLRARHGEMVARIDSLDVDGAVKDALFKRAEAIDPELWMTPEAVLEGVRNADALFESLRAEVAQTSRE